MKTVRSFTFSFDRVPQDQTAAPVLAALALGLALLAAVELFWRSAGASASYIESYARWARERDRIESADGPRRTAVLGASRILFNLSLETFAARRPEVPIAQLAVAAKGPIAALESLAEDSEFNGVVLFDFNPETLLPPREQEQADYVDYYRSRWSLDQQANFLIANAAEPWLVTRHSYYGLKHLAETLLAQRRLPEVPLYLIVRENREHDADFSVADGRRMLANRMPEMARRYQELHSSLDRTWPAMLRTLASAVDRIHGRGGCVVLIRMPSAGQLLQEDERVFSGRRYWEDVLTHLSVYGVHYRAIEGVYRIPLPDGEHVDVRDQARFTRALLDELDRVGIYDPARPCRPLLPRLQASN